MGSGKLKISFIVPIYNTERYLEKCLESIKKQTDESFEAILIDDGSTDNCANICQMFCSSDNRFIYKYKENGGLASARNLGLTLVSGEYIAFVDSDDYIEADFIKTIYDYAKITDADIVGFNHKKVNFDGSITTVQTYKQKLIDFEYQSLTEHFCIDWLTPPSKVYVWSKLFRSKFINKAKITFNVNLRYAEERNFCYKALALSRKTAYTDYCAYFYVQHTASITQNVKASLNNDIERNVFYAYILSCFDIFAFWKGRDIHELDELKPMVLIRALQSAMLHAKNGIKDMPTVAEEFLYALTQFDNVKELEIDKMHTAISLFCKVCNLTWEEKSQYYMFALSILDGKEGIIAWQGMFSAINAKI